MRSLTVAYTYQVIPIPGCRTATRVEENAAAAELELSLDDVQAIRTLCKGANIRGERKPPQYMVPMDCIPLEE